MEHKLRKKNTNDSMAIWYLYMCLGIQHAWFNYISYKYIQNTNPAMYVFVFYFLVELQILCMTIHFLRHSAHTKKEKVRKKLENRNLERHFCIKTFFKHFIPSVHAKSGLFWHYIRAFILCERRLTLFFHIVSCTEYAFLIFKWLIKAISRTQLIHYFKKNWMYFFKSVFRLSKQ